VVAVSPVSGQWQEWHDAAAAHARPAAAALPATVQSATGPLAAMVLLKGLLALLAALGTSAWRIANHW
jgi:hypothetical protein